MPCHSHLFTASTVNASGRNKRHFLIFTIHSRWQQKCTDFVSGHNKATCHSAAVNYQFLYHKNSIFVLFRIQYFVGIQFIPEHRLFYKIFSEHRLLGVQTPTSESLSSTIWVQICFSVGL